MCFEFNEILKVVVTLLSFSDGLFKSYSFSLNFSMMTVRLHDRLWNLLCLPVRPDRPLHGLRNRPRLLQLYGIPRLGRLVRPIVARFKKFLKCSLSFMNKVMQWSESYQNKGKKLFIYIWMRGCVSVYLCVCVSVCLSVCVCVCPWEKVE